MAKGKSGNVWQCSCGEVAYGINPPEECEKCSSLDSYSIVPEDLAAEIEEDFLIKNLPGVEDED